MNWYNVNVKSQISCHSGTLKPKPARNATTESASGFEDESAVSEGELNFQELAKGLRTGLGDLIRVVPDLFKGAREAVGLLSGIQSLLSSFGS